MDTSLVQQFNESCKLENKQVTIRQNEWICAKQGEPQWKNLIGNKTVSWHQLHIEELNAAMLLFFRKNEKENFLWIFTEMLQLGEKTNAPAMITYCMTRLIKLLVEEVLFIDVAKVQCIFGKIQTWEQEHRINNALLYDAALMAIECCSKSQLVKDIDCNYANFALQAADAENLATNAPKSWYTEAIISSPELHNIVGLCNALKVLLEKDGTDDDCFKIVGHIYCISNATEATVKPRKFSKTKAIYVLWEFLVFLASSSSNDNLHIAVRTHLSNFKNMNEWFPSIVVAVLLIKYQKQIDWSTKTAIFQDVTSNKWKELLEKHSAHLPNNDPKLSTIFGAKAEVDSVCSFGEDSKWISKDLRQNRLTSKHGSNKKTKKREVANGGGSNIPFVTFEDAKLIEFIDSKHDFIYHTPEFENKIFKRVTKSNAQAAILYQKVKKILQIYDIEKEVKASNLEICGFAEGGGNTIEKSVKGTFYIIYSKEQFEAQKINLSKYDKNWMNNATMREEAFKLLILRYIFGSPDNTIRSFMYGDGHVYALDDQKVSNTVNIKIFQKMSKSLGKKLKQDIDDELYNEFLANIESKTQEIMDIVNELKINYTMQSLKFAIESIMPSLIDALNEH